jgi:hypothetical protein
MQVRGSIKSIKINSKEIKINFIDKVKFEEEMIIFKDEKPEKMSEWENEVFKVSCKSISIELLYQLYRDGQQIIFEIKKTTSEENTETTSEEITKTYEVTSLEICDE